MSNDLDRIVRDVLGELWVVLGVLDCVVSLTDKSAGAHDCLIQSWKTMLTQASAAPHSYYI